MSATYKSSKIEEVQRSLFLGAMFKSKMFLSYSTAQKKQNESYWREFPFQQNISEASLAKIEGTFSSRCNAAPL
jgi:hypothetical protein